jgi:hypothetical protein
MAAKRKAINRMPSGGPTVYTVEIADEICERLAKGESLNAICASESRFPTESTVRNWAIEDREGFFAKYTRARDIQADVHAESIIGIADTATAENAQAVRLQIDARKWFASKVKPKVYGDKVEQQITGANGGPIVFKLETVGDANDKTAA